MKIDLVSFIFGAIIMLAIVVVVERIYGTIWGNRRLRQLKREVVKLKGILRKKDELIKKSLKAIEEAEKKDERENK